jgi:hypothetical protein
MGSFFNPLTFNSTTYVDALAIQLGLFQDRMVGETSDHFLDRLYSAAYNKRDHTLEGTINNISYQLGLSLQAGIVVTPTNPLTVITVSVGRITFAPASGSPLVIPTVSISPDDMWEWRSLSDVVLDINNLSSGALTATLQIPDALAIQLVPQCSLKCSVAENVVNTTSQLNNTGIVVGSELFNVAVPAYTITTAGALTFASSPPAGTTISYMYNMSPFILTCSPVSVINLMDPALQDTAVCPDGSLVYQVREFNQQILTLDSCYWG